MQKTYLDVSEQVFYQDLMSKDYIGLLLHEPDIICGFTTYAINPAGSGTQEYDVLFSGDTIIHPEYRGTQELVRGFGHTIGSLLILSQARRKKLYWFLISKGHRTYLYLPIFFAKFFPVCLPDREAPLKKDLDRIAKLVFKNNYDPYEGLIKYTDPTSRLKSTESQITMQRARNKHVAYFLEKNPGFETGQELACLTEICLENMLRTGRQYVQEGMERPIC